MEPMTSLPPSSKYRQRASEAVDDLERESLTTRLSDAYADGRLDQDSYMAALDVVYDARSLGELVPVVEQLPAPAVSVPAIVGGGSSVPAGETAQGRNVLVPAMIAVGGVLLLLMILAIVLGVMVF